MKHDRDGGWKVGRQTSEHFDHRLQAARGASEREEIANDSFPIDHGLAPGTTMTAGSQGVCQSTRPAGRSFVRGAKPSQRTNVQPTANLTV